MFLRFGRALFALIALFAAVTNVLADPDPAARVISQRWPAGGVRLYLSSSLFKANPNIKAQSDIAGAFQRAAAHWSSIADVSIVSSPSNRQSASPAGPKGDGYSLVTIAATPENVVLFGSDTTIAAKTRIFSDGKGTISEADIVLNPFAQFSTDGSYGTFDLETVLTHEIGHVLGLRHSVVMGSMMYENVDPNGMLLLGGFKRKELSGEDVALARSLYGPADSSFECCGTVTGKVTGGSKDIARALVVIYDSHGRVAGTSTVSPTRDFSISGLEAGRYSAYVVDPKQLFGDRPVGDINVDQAGTATLSIKFKSQSKAPSLQFIGDRGLLGTSPTMLVQGSESTLMIGGKGLTSDGIELYTNAPAIKVEDDPLADVDYSEEVSAVRFRISVSEYAKPGTYSIFARSKNGAVSSLVGAIVVPER